MSGSFQTFTAKTSSFPITKVLSCGLDVFAGFPSAEVCSAEEEPGVVWAFPELSWATKPMEKEAMLKLRPGT